MPKYKVTIESEVILKINKVIEIEANDEDEANDAALDDFYEKYVDTLRLKLGEIGLRDTFDGVNFGDIIVIKE